MVLAFDSMNSAVRFPTYLGINNSAGSDYSNSETPSAGEKTFVVIAAGRCSYVSGAGWPEGAGKQLCADSTGTQVAALNGALVTGALVPSDHIPITSATADVAAGKLVVVHDATTWQAFKLAADLHFGDLFMTIEPQAPTFASTDGATVKLSGMTWTLRAFQTDKIQLTGLWLFTATGNPGAAAFRIVPWLKQPADVGQYVNWVCLQVTAWTGAKVSNPIGTVVKGNATGSPLSTLITPSAPGSALLFASSDAETTPVTAVAGAGCYLIGNIASVGTINHLWYGTVGGPTINPGEQTLGLTSAGTTPLWEWMAYEVLAETVGVKPDNLAITAHAN
jgi:hypothetical protein